jgi:hypothetical protein
MNFYSVNGNNYDNQVYQSFNNQNIETFENIEYNVSSQSDSSYQCSDNYVITGQNILSGNLSVDLCKKSCQSDVNCVGFDYNNNTKTCNLYKNVDSLSTPDPNSFFCIRKKSGMCKLNQKSEKSEESEESEEEQQKTSSTTSTQEIKNMMSNQQENLNYKKSYDELLNDFKTRLDVLNSLVSQNTALMSSIDSINKGLTNIDNRFVNAQSVQQELSENNKLFSIVKAENEDYKREIDKYNSMIKELELKLSKKCDRENIYVDLNCYLGKMETLKNHSENMMVDLSVLASNIKSCSYVNKSKSRPIKTSSLTEQVIDKIVIPTPNEVSLSSILGTSSNLATSATLTQPNTETTVTVTETTEPIQESQETEESEQSEQSEQSEESEQSEKSEESSEQTESFANVGKEYQFKWLSSDLLVVIGILLIFWIIIFQRKKN